MLTVRISFAWTIAALSLVALGLVLVLGQPFAVAHAVQRLFTLFGSSTRPSSRLWHTRLQLAQMNVISSVSSDMHPQV